VSLQEEFEDTKYTNCAILLGLPNAPQIINIYSVSGQAEILLKVALNTINQIKYSM
jgi:hypothetical protein